MTPPTAPGRGRARRGGARQGPFAGLDAWVELRHSPLFWISAVLIAVLRGDGDLPAAVHLDRPRLRRPGRGPGGAVVRRPGSACDAQGYDIYARTIYGARASIIVGLGASSSCWSSGSIGLLAGFSGGWLDTVLSRFGEIFFAIPLLLGGILFLYLYPTSSVTPTWSSVGKIVFVLGHPRLAADRPASCGPRCSRCKPSDYVQAARALGAAPCRVICSHILPNAIAPVIVVATINLGVYIAVEATLSFLGIGLQPPAISWGSAISEASGSARCARPAHAALPELFLSLTVLAFIMLGDAVRDALDPKLR